MLLIVLLLSIFVIFFMLSMVANYFILGRNLKKTILVSLLMTIIAIFSHVSPMIMYQWFF